ncbi:MAG: seryl-tRNA synthetase [Chloroflexota bacterium]|nr:seryl-tRNA synthetase [Chloroflexota bacterium]
MSVGIQRLREDADRVRQGAIDKGEDTTLVDRALALDADRRQLTGEIDGLRSERKARSDEVAAAMRAGDRERGEELRRQSSELSDRIHVLGEQLGTLEADLEDAMLRIPNPPDAGIPVGGADASEIVRTWGEPAAGEGRKPHWEIAESLGIIDMAAGAKVAGSGFPIYRGAGAALQRSLIDFFLDLHTREHGMTEIWPPAVVNEASARGTGQIPDKEDQMYVVGRDGLYLVPTAEVPVTNIHRDEIIDADRLPIRYVAYSPCFRREAGAAGARTRGILRVHQFDKVEMVCFERPGDSDGTLEWLTQRAEVCLQRLGLAYRVKLMATGDMGFTQAKKYDLEVWAPGVQDWLEVSSVSNFRDFQARRMNIRWRPEPGAKAEILHTLNGSGLALARTVAAILEVYQEPDGSVRVPEPLRPRLGERITSPND